MEKVSMHASSPKPSASVEFMECMYIIHVYILSSFFTFRV